MLIQQVGDRQIVYVSDYKSEYMDVAKEFGMVDEFGHFHDYVQGKEEGYRNSNGIMMPAFHLIGKTVNLFIVNDHIEAKSNNVQDIVDALNYFPEDSRFTIAGHTFVSKFKNDHGYLRDVAKRGISMRNGCKKDLAKIHDLMTHLNLNNGKLFEPVIARYVYTSREMPRYMHLVGYFDLEKYLRIISDPSAAAFNHTGGDLLVYFDMGTKLFSVKVTNVVKDCCELEITGPKAMYDLKKMADFKPLVVLTKTPLRIKDAKFPWVKVRFDRTDVFMTPLMSKEDAWETLQGGLDLLSIPQKESKKNV